MKRVEIIGNRSIQEDMFDVFTKYQLLNNYTIIPVVHGAGSSTPKQGDTVWPEENFLFISYCSADALPAFKEALQELKSYFPDEGIKMFLMEAEMLI
jgi:hypothetical protein